MLQLDATATAYLHGLVASGGHPPPAGSEAGPEAVPEGTRLLLDALGMPAFVECRAFDVLATNARATALSPAIRPGANRLRSMFLDHAERALHVEWAREAATMVGEFRASVGPNLQDPRVVALVEELSRGSAAFRDAWGRHDVDLWAGVVSRWTHPVAGPLELHRGNYPVPGTEGQVLVVYFAGAGSVDAARLARLG